MSASSKSSKQEEVPRILLTEIFAVLAKCHGEDYLFGDMKPKVVIPGPWKPRKTDGVDYHIEETTDKNGAPIFTATSKKLRYVDSLKKYICRTRNTLVTGIPNHVKFLSTLDGLTVHPPNTGHRIRAPLAEVYEKALDVLAKKSESASSGKKRKAADQLNKAYKKSRDLGAQTTKSIKDISNLVAALSKWQDSNDEKYLLIINTKLAVVAEAENMVADLKQETQELSQAYHKYKAVLEDISAPAEPYDDFVYDDLRADAPALPLKHEKTPVEQEEDEVDGEDEIEEEEDDDIEVEWEGDDEDEGVKYDDCASCGSTSCPPGNCRTPQCTNCQKFGHLLEVCPNGNDNENEYSSSDDSDSDSDVESII